MKEEIRTCLYVGIIFGLLFIFCFILWDTQSKYNFTISIPICYNQTHHYCSGFKEIDLESPDCFFGIQEEVCSLEKVSEKSLKQAWDICWKDGISKEDFILCSLMEEGKLDFDKITFPFECERKGVRNCGISISKKDLTIEWLDLNCKLISLESIKNKNDLKARVYPINQYSCFEGEINYCEYSCGKYVVGVEK